jgi:hypothetical protein
MEYRTVIGFKVQRSNVIFTTDPFAKIVRLPKFYDGQVHRAGSESSNQ